MGYVSLREGTFSYLFVSFLTKVNFLEEDAAPKDSGHFFLPTWGLFAAVGFGSL